MIYLDYQATTPLAPEVRDAMRPWMDEWFFNPHSAHAGGRRAAAAVEVARGQVAALLPSDGKVTFTSGATEAINWAQSCTLPEPDGMRRRIVIVESEHAAVRDTAFALGERGYEVTLLEVGPDGLIDPDRASLTIDERTIMVAAMLVNNEIGVIQDVELIADLAHRVGALLLCDCVQGFGRMPIPEGPDLIALSAHKIHGPKSIGALWVRGGVRIAPMIHGGGQQKDMRSGTLSPALCAGFGAASRIAAERMNEDAAHVAKLWDAARSILSDWTLNGSEAHRYKGNLNLRLDGLDVARLMSELRDIYFSAGSACASGSGRPSHVLSAIGLSDAEAKSSVRLGFGRYTTLAEVEEAARRIDAAAKNIAGS